MAEVRRPRDPTRCLRMRPLHGVATIEALGSDMLKSDDRRTSSTMHERITMRKSVEKIRRGSRGSGLQILVRRGRSRSSGTK